MIASTYYTEGWPTNPVFQGKSRLKWTAWKWTACDGGLMIGTHPFMLCRVVDEFTCPIHTSQGRDIA